MAPLLPPLLQDKRFHVTLAAVIVAAATVGGGVTAGDIWWGSPPGPGAVFNVTFDETALDWGYCSGWQRYDTTITHDFEMKYGNLTWVYFTFVWSDEAGSPLMDPDVQLKFESPNGTLIYNGPGPQTETTWNVSLNPVPQDSTVEAETPEEAFAAALEGAGANETLGVGLWNWTLTVGPLPYARNQIRSGAHFECWYGYGTFVANVTNATAPV